MRLGKDSCVLFGISKHDNAKDLEYMVRKILNLRLFDDENGVRWKHSVKDKEYELLCVSQFTLQSVLKGNKPDFHNAMGAENSQAFYDSILTELGKNYNPEKIKNGKFGAYMQVEIQNDGPVTIEINSPQNQNKSKQEDTT